MHDIGVIIAGKYVTGTAHIGRQLVNFAIVVFNDGATETRVAQITNDKLVCRTGAMLVRLQIDTAHPKPLIFETPSEMPSNEAACTTDQCLFHLHISYFIFRGKPPHCRTIAIFC